MVKFETDSPKFKDICHYHHFYTSFPGGPSGKESACQCRRPRDRFSPIHESGRFPGGGNGTSLQYSGLENSMDRGAWWAIGLDQT